MNNNLNKIWREIICLGDSLTYGARDEYGRSFPHELSSILTSETNELWVCHNHGINGETSNDLLRRSWDILSKKQNIKIITLLIGTNDTKLPTKPEIYKDNVTQIIKMCHVFDMNLIVANIPNFFFSPAYLKNKNLLIEYNKILDDLSKIYQFKLIKLDGVEKLLIDGVHFNNEGNRFVAKKFKDAVLSL